MMSILRNALFLAAFLVLAAPQALADEKPVRLNQESTMDFEIIGAFEGYQAVPVELPLSVYASVGKELRRAVLPAAGAAGHTLSEVITKQDDLATKITARRLAGGKNNPHTEADWVKRLGIWKKIEAAMVQRLDQVLRAANKRGETILVEHAVLSYAALAKAAQDARRRLQRRGLLNAKMVAHADHAKVRQRARATFLEVGRRDLKAKVSPSFTGRWQTKGSGWGLVTLNMPSKTKLAGTWDGGKRQRKIRGVMLKDGITARIQYAEDGNWRATKYLARVSDDGRSLMIWSKYTISVTLRRK